MRLSMQRSCFAVVVCCVSVGPMGCGGGVPVQLRIDEFTMNLSVDEAVTVMEQGLASAGFLPLRSGLPEVWPDSLPDIRWSIRVGSPPMPVDLNPLGGGDGGEETTDQGNDGSEDPALASKYDQINQVGKAIKRIEINRLVLRLERNNVTISLPELSFQLADSPAATEENRAVWYTIGKIPSAPPGFVDDLEFEFLPGGESLLNAQLADQEKAFGLKAAGSMIYDTEVDPKRPRGVAVMRLIVVATFFIEAVDAL